ncbi:MAG: hypothetical protein M1830_009754 [Pleopsidium flavum]|nr:MAG: hypothetical protein M1830_009754 [Pleopsidium flavum]
MPDALSKTIPIWCNVLNTLLFPDLPDSHTLFTPPQVVSRSEHAQIESRLPNFIKAFEVLPLTFLPASSRCTLRIVAELRARANIQALQLPLEDLRKKLTKPFRPLWVTPDAPFPPAPLVLEGVYPVICCTASRRVEGAEAWDGGGYIQGAGDDAESWAHGLTPALFWANSELLLRTREEELPLLIEKLAREEQAGSGDGGGNATLIKPTAGAYIGTTNTILSPTSKTQYDLIVICSETDVQDLAKGADKKVLNLRCGSGKLGSRHLRKELYKVKELIASRVDIQKTTMLCACPTGKDLAVGVALMVLCLFFDDEGRFVGLQQSLTIDKQFIRHRLSWIMASKPDANPSRSTLQAVNSVLMGRPP